jgi:hypothetical protein
MTDFYPVAYRGKQEAHEELKALRKAEETESTTPKHTFTRTALVVKFVKCLRAQYVPQWYHKVKMAKIKKHPILLGFSYWI